jgi:polyhydroxyalkanoate synthesis regulator phasin
LLKEPTQNDIDVLANENLRNGLTQDVSEARSMAKNELHQNLTAQRGKVERFVKDASARMALDLQGSGIGDFKDIAGEIQNRLLDEGSYLVGAGKMSPEEASNKMSDIIKELGKTATQTKTTGAKSFLTTGSKEKIRAWREQKKEFEKYGFGEIFDDMAAASQGITPLQAAHSLDPLKNEEIKKNISRGFFKHNLKGEKTKLSDKNINKIAEKITPDTNILSIAYLVREKGLDVNDFIGKISELSDANKLALTEQQRRQIKKPISGSRFGDILFNVF